MRSLLHGQCDWTGWRFCRKQDAWRHSSPSALCCRCTGPQSRAVCFASTGIVWAPDAQTVVTLSCSQGWKPTTAKCGQANLLDSTQGGHARFLATHARHIHPKVSWDSNGGHPKDGKVQRVDRRGADSRDSTPNTHIPHASTHTHEHARTRIHRRSHTHTHTYTHTHTHTHRKEPSSCTKSSSPLLESMGAVHRKPRHSATWATRIS